MDHVAIMRKSWGLIPKILSGEKAIESRWYQTRRAPWNLAKAGDVIYFKNSGEPVTARATVSGVLQFEIPNRAELRRLIQKYGDEICLVNRNPDAWPKRPKYCVLLRLRAPQKLKMPFRIDKRGFGCSAAWLTMDDIRRLVVK